MLASFLNFIFNHKLFDKDEKVLVAVSGGKDSLVLLDLMHKAGFSVLVAHCNFKLRQAESDEDENFVEGISLKYGFDFYSKSFETKKYAKEKRLSTQMAARELRYIWFDQLAKQMKVEKIVTAHHLNDSIETSLLNFVKGTGVAGLRGILKENNNIIRPLIHFSRTEIDTYAKEHKIEWREDSSNVSDDYQRNLIRNRVIPILEDINPSLTSSFIRTSERLKSLERMLDDEIERAKFKIQKSGLDHTVTSDFLLSLELVVLEGIFKEYGFNWDQLINIRKGVVNNAVGKEFDSSKYTLNIDREKVIISPKVLENDADILISGPGDYKFGAINLTCEESDDQQFIVSKNTAKVDYSALTFPLKLRVWRQGDAFQPLGMKGKKKLSDFMIDEKIPLNLKKRVLVITSEDKIVWVVGHRLDDRFKITNNTKRAFIFAVEK